MQRRYESTPALWRAPDAAAAVIAALQRCWPWPASADTAPALLLPLAVAALIADYCRSDDDASASAVAAPAAVRASSTSDIAAALSARGLALASGSSDDGGEAPAAAVRASSPVGAADSKQSDAAVAVAAADALPPDPGSIVLIGGDLLEPSAVDQWTQV